ncbi:hypothetical protein HPB51_017409 [Rhipicephalus microplus]|uniref:Uncharacterized protein n=1 Tax=Rhipicephalus microplus TaxID=6941 RepID=A0A9J6DBH6_RHIMP|nr:hypothetical protein HPB51_017409 [Rhipicephalus microplus]
MLELLQSVAANQALEDAAETLVFPDTRFFRHLFSPVKDRYVTLPHLFRLAHGFQELLEARRHTPSAAGEQALRRLQAAKGRPTGVAERGRQMHLHEPRDENSFEAGRRAESRLPHTPPSRSESRDVTGLHVAS